MTLKTHVLILALLAIVSCASPPPVTQVRTRDQTSADQLIQMFGPAVKDYKVPGRPNYRVIAFRPLFRNWHNRVFLYKNDHYLDQASGQFPVEVKAEGKYDVRIVRTGPSAGPPQGPPKPRGG